MSSTVLDPEKKSQEIEATEANSVQSPDPQAWPVPRFQEGMGNHPLWQEYLAELEAIRQADIAEANRQADLALEP